MTVISTINVARAIAMEVDPRSPCFLSIVFRSRNLAACTLRPQLQFGTNTQTNHHPHTRTAHHIHPCKKFNNLLQKLKFIGRQRKCFQCSETWVTMGEETYSRAGTSNAWGLDEENYCLLLSVCVKPDGNSDSRAEPGTSS